MASDKALKVTPGLAIGVQLVYEDSVWLGLTDGFWLSS